jgi:hypothetical protein
MPETQYFEEHVIRHKNLEITVEPESVIIGFPDEELYTTIDHQTFIEICQIIIFNIARLYSYKNNQNP